MSELSFPLLVEMGSPILIESFPIYVQRETVERQWTGEVLLVIQKICDENISRLERGVTDLKALKKGIFLGNEYSLTLRANIEHQLSTSSKKKSLDLFHKLYFDHSFYHGYTDCKQFKRVLAQGNRTPFSINGFVIDSGLPSQALEKMIGGCTILDSMGVGQLAYLKGLLKVLGKEKFDFLCGPDGPTPLVIDGKNMMRDKISILSRLILEKPIEEHKGPGECIQIGNARNFAEKHIDSDYASYFVMCIGDNEEGKEKFVGLGFSSEGVTVEKIRENLFNEYNKKPIRTSEIMPVTEGSSLWEEQREHEEKLEKTGLGSETITFNKFRRNGGGKELVRLAPNFERIHALAIASFEEARRLIDSWRPLVDLESET